MKTFRLLLLATLFGILGTGCSTITFVQYEQTDEQETENRWHHATLNGMVEISRPLNVTEICEKTTWTKITTEHTFYNGLAVILIPTTGFVSFYSAWTNKVECYQPSAAQ